MAKTARRVLKDYLEVSEAGTAADLIRTMIGSLAEAPLGSIPIVNQDGLLGFTPWLRWFEDTKLLASGMGINSLLNARLGVNFAKTSDTTLADIAPAASQPLSVSVVQNGVYKLSATLFTTSNVAGGVKCALGGTCTLTSGLYEACLGQAGAFVAPGTSRVNSASLGTAIADVTAVTAATIYIEGLLEVATAGTLTLQFAQNASNAGASTVLAGSHMILTPMS